MNNSEFYNSLSSDYDEMINFENSLKNKVESLKNFISPNYKTALDLGCGTGVDSIALSRFGLFVDSIDHSEKMIKEAIKNSRRYGAQINFHLSDLKDIKFVNNYDIIISLGNTLANISLPDLKKLIKTISKSLNEKGQIIIQIINFKSLPKSGEYILSQMENNNLSIIRKYNIHKEYIDFSIEIKDHLVSESSQITTKIYPHTIDDLKSIAEENQLAFSIYESLKKTDYNSGKSKNLVTVLKK